MSLAALGECGLILSGPLWLIALPVCVLPLLWARWSRRRGRRIAPWATAAQCVALALVVAALAGPRAPLRAGARLPWLMLADASGSVRGQPSPALPPGVPAERWAFAEGLSRTAPASDAATDAAPSLRLIASRSPADAAGAVIATDGRFTDPDWRAAARAAAGSGIPILIVPMSAPPPDARVVSLTARRQGARVEVAVAVSANAPLQRTLTVRRTGRAEPLLERPLNLLPDAPATFRLSDTPPPDSPARYTALLSPPEAIAENDSAEAWVLPTTSTIAAVGPAERMRTWLRDAGMPIASIARSADLPAEGAELAGFAGIVLLDPAGDALTPAQRRAVGRFVESGGGLVLLGSGPSATPADRHDPLNRVLPLVPDPFRRRPLQLTVLLDHSGSMSQEAPPRPGAPVQRKFDLAAEAVVALKEQLTPRDALTVITFADQPEVVYHQAGEVDVGRLREALSRPPAGSTNVTPAIAEALSRPVPEGLTPMLLILSDLQTETFDPRAWAEKIRQGKAHLAVVAVGRAETDGAEPPLEAMTRLAGGDYFRQEDLSGLAEVFARLVRRGRGETVRRERTALAVVGPLFDTSLTSLPEVDAYALAGKVPAAELLARTAGGDPVLARRQAGLGRSVCLALPLDGTNIGWQGDPRAAELISGAARWVARSMNDPRLDVKVARTPGGLEVEATVRTDGVGVDGLALSAHVWADAPPAVAPLEQVGPGRYAGTVPAEFAGRAAMVAVRDSKGAALWQEPLPQEAGREFRAIGPDDRRLRELAELTGGAIVPSDRLAGAVGAIRTRRLTDLWPLLLGAALLIMLAEWSLARITQEPPRKRPGPAS